MIKKLCTLLLLSIVSFGYSQAGIGANPQQSKESLFFPTSSEAYAFDKVGKLPMDLFNGKANISIPIYEVKMGEFTFPIQLSYNTGGIKQNEVSSSVGLGWALSIPNTVTKNVMGKDDEFTPVYFKDYNLALQHSSVSLSGDNDKKEVLQWLYEGVYDTKPDLFTYNLPTTGGSFILNNDIGYTIPHEETKIERSNGNAVFKITDTKNNRFWLSGKNSVTTRRAQVTPQISVNLYALDSLRTNTNDYIKIEYGKNLSYTEQAKYESKIIISDGIPPGYEPFPPVNTDPPVRTDQNTNREKLITKIIFKDGEVNFRYSDDDNLNTIAGEQYRKDINSSQGVALRRIIVKNKAGRIIKDISLNYSYFESNNVNKTYPDYRLKLMNVVNNLDNTKHSFTYNEEYPLPARNSNADDYWGYFNNNISGNSGLPNAVVAPQLGVYIPTEKLPTGRNKSTNPAYAQLGVLTSIQYPTGASKNLYYESNTLESSHSFMEDAYESLGGLGNDYDPVADIPLKNSAITVPLSAYADKPGAVFEAHFGNGCLNNGNGTGGPSEVTPTFCRGTVTVDNTSRTSTGAPFTYTFPVTPSPIQLKLIRSGDCGCQISLKVKYKKTVTSIDTQHVGGLRVKKVEDVDQNNISNVYNYSYLKFNAQTSSYSSGKLKQPFQFVKSFYRVTHPEPTMGMGADYIDKGYTIENSGNAYTSYNSSNIVTYSKVTEFNDLGEIVYEYNDGSGAGNVYTNTSQPYDSWRYGMPLKITYKKNGDTLRKETFKYEFNPIKNKLSGYNNVIDDQIAFGLDVDIVPYTVGYQFGNYLSTYQVDMRPIDIYGAKIEKKQSKTTEYFQNNKVIESVTDYNYSDTDVNKPITLRSTVNTLPSGESILTTYQYAHDKANQLLIGKNMIDTPLETQTTQTMGGVSKNISKTETIYPVSLPNASAGNLILPVAAKSYDLNNNTTAYTEVTYDRYDDKGNVTQYTTKNGMPVSIIWGYNKTLPIIKVEGALYDDIKGLRYVLSAISASNQDFADSTQEPVLLGTLYDVRVDAAFQNYQVSTYTYDSLLGVTSITPPSGIREVYKYDSANRLEKVVDANGKVLKEYQYHYKN
ncbi:RHS repeat protein [Chryseobacterium soli]|uniref:RHS repeat domain-containing protein n=1 Tax=Chryseobacterium soli TaxID=445961 RepID=UPI002953F83D|nr:RHS repeat domain-containing protein [Chryseobacterium soli]MDV7697441.1 RHS repeat protein [Chryseobacterium soli]